MAIRRRGHEVSGFQSFYKHIMTGISYMIPILIMGGQVLQEIMEELNLK